MEGSDLYDIYWREMLNQGVECDGWDDLSDADRKAWDHVAKAVS